MKIQADATQAEYDLADCARSLQRRLQTFVAASTVLLLATCLLFCARPADAIEPVQAIFDGSLNDVTDMAFSSGGDHLYAVGFSGAIWAFESNMDGTLSFIEEEREGIDGVIGLLGAQSVVVAPDGNHVYVASHTDDAVAVFSRDSSTGALTFVEAHFDGLDGVNGLVGAFSVAVSPGGSQVYVASELDNAVAILT